MTSAELLRTLHAWQERLGLGHWDVQIDFEDSSDPDTYAQVGWHPSARTATITVEEDWQGWDQARADEVICHELLHIHLRGVSWAYEGLLAASSPGRKARSLARKAWAHEEEQTLEAMSRALARAWPSAPDVPAALLADFGIRPK